MRLLEDRITPHFRLSEFSNTEDGDVVLLNPDVIQFIQMLEEFRVWYDRIMNITSGYRTKAFNKKWKGDANSYHLKGLAADIRLPLEYYKFTEERKLEFLNNVKNKWYEICERRAMPSTGQRICGSVIWEPTWIHLDVRTGKQYFDDKRGDLGWM